MIEMHPHGYSFAMQSVACRSAAPTVTLIPRDQNGSQPLVLPVQGQFHPVPGFLVTPAGRVSISELDWTHPDGYRIVFTLGNFVDRQGVLLNARFHNGSNHDIRLRNFVLLQTEGLGLSVQGDPAAWVLNPLGAISVGRLVANLENVLPSPRERMKKAYDAWGMALPVMPPDEETDDGRWRTMNDMCGLFTDKGRQGLAMAAVSTESYVAFKWFVDTGQCRLSIVSKMDDVLVAVGEWHPSETVAVLGGTFEDTVESLMGWIAQTHGHRTQRKPVVGFMSWNGRGPHVNAKELVDIAGFVRDHRDQIPMDIFQIDDGWQRQVGDWEPNEKFPNGWEPVVSAIEAAGVIPGVWMAPILMDEKVGCPNFKEQAGPLLERFPYWFQRNEKGELAGGAMTNWKSKAYRLDPTHPEVRDFIKHQIRRLRQEGFRYFKFDFVHVAGDARLHDRTKTHLQVGRDLYRLFREEIGEETIMLGAYTRMAIGYADFLRIGTDTCEFWDAPHGACLRGGVLDVATNAFTNGLLFGNDPDAGYTLPREHMTLDEIRTFLGFAGLAGGMITIPEPLARPEYQTAESLRMYEILVHPAPEKGRPFHPGCDPDQKRFGIVAQRPWGRFITVVVYNPGEEPADIPLDIPGASALLGEKFHAWSFWNNHYLGVTDASHVLKGIKPHHSVVLRLTPCAGGTEATTLVGSTLHISCGAAEIAGILDVGNCTCVTLTDSGARSGALTFASRRTLRVVEYQGMSGARIESRGDGLWDVLIDSRRRGEVQFVAMQGLE